jgi:molybdate transport system regulatory protein
MPRVLPGKIDTLLALRANGRLLVGRERIMLLEAVIKHGSITKAGSRRLQLQNRLGRGQCD